MNRSWSEQDGRICREMIADHYTARVVSGVIGKTRRAVIGYCHRNGIVMPNGRNGKPKSPTRLKPVSLGHLTREKPFTRGLRDISGITGPEDEKRLHRASGCRYPIGHPGEPDFHFCDKPRQAGKESYCAVHDKLCHTASYVTPKIGWK